MAIIESGLNMIWVARKTLDPNQAPAHPQSRSSDYPNEQPAVDWPPRELRSDHDSLGRLWDRYAAWPDPEDLIEE